MWTCPKCHRAFRAKNQWHSCVSFTADDLFLDKPAAIKSMYVSLHERCSLFCQLTTDTTKTCIYFVEGSRFLSIKPHKNGLVLEFVPNRKEDIFPVIRIVEIGKNRFVHRLKLDEPHDITSQVTDWIKEALRADQERLKKIKHF